MEYNKRLEEIFQEHFGWNKARIKFLVLFIISLIKVSTVNLSKIALGFNAKAKDSSNYRRLQRFFSKFTIEFDCIAKLVIGLLPQKEDLVLTMDRTNWKLGKTNINILVLGAAYKGIAFPIFLEVFG